MRNDMSGSAAYVVQAQNIGSITYAEAAPPPLVPALVPPPPDGFTDREAIVAKVRELVATVGAGRVTPLVVCVHGIAGVGKSALVRHIAAVLGESFADGSLHVDCGPDGDSPAEAAERMLVALGMPEQRIPTAFKRRKDVLQSLTARRRLIVVFDDVTDAAQVSPLLPNSGASLVLIAARRDDFIEDLLLDGVAVVPVKLDPLSTPDAIRMVHTACPDGRVTAAPDAAKALVEACGGLPLALHLVSARLCVRPDWTVQRLVDEVRTPGDELLSERAKRTLRRTYELIYAELPDRLRLLYRMLGAFVGEHFRPDLIAAVAGVEDVRADLAELAANGLIDRVGDAYAMHWMVRTHALERTAEEDDDQARAEWLRRAVRWWLAGATVADLAATGEDRLRVADVRALLGDMVIDLSAAAARGWLDREHANILRAMRAAAAQGWHDEVWQLFEAMFALYDARRPLADWVRAGELAVESAARSKNADAEARCRCLLAKAYQELENYPAAHAQLDLARALPMGERMRASVLDFTGNVHLRQGADEVALQCFEEALEINEKLGRRRGTAMQAMLSARALSRLGRIDEAMARLVRARELVAGTPSESLMPRILLGTAKVHLEAGRAAEAAAALADTVSVAERFEQTAIAADALTLLADTAGDEAFAASCRAKAQAAYETMGSPRAVAQLLAGLPAE